MGLIESALSTLRHLAAANSDEELSWKMDTVVLCMFVFSAIGVIFSPGNYGRYAATWKGLKIPARLAWALESPAFIIPIALAFAPNSTRASSTPNAILITLYAAHYINRTLVYPQVMVNPSPIPITTAVAMIIFQAVHATTEGIYLSRVKCYGQDWIYDPRFIIGVALFAAGMSGNIYSDHIICKLRRNYGSLYAVPQGGFLFRWLVCPNYACEVVEWCGWALAASGPTPLYFALFCLIYLGSRSYHHRRYYQDKFKEDFPSDRKLLIPFVF